MSTYGLIGYPLGHSFSKLYFTEKFNKENINSIYNLFPIENINLVSDLISSNLDLRGFNVTIPYKEQIIPFLDEVEEEASAIGAVNVVKIIERDGKRILKGYNSDIYGFYESIRPFIKTCHKKALILGTGGASKAIAAMLRKLNIIYTFVSRSAKDGQLSYLDINAQIMKEYTVIINCSPVGMSPNVDEAPMLPYEYFTDEHIAYDLVYNPLETKFLKLAKEHGATTKNGLEMLYLQAERAWSIWQKEE